MRGQARMWNLAGITATTAGQPERADQAFREELALNETLEDIVCPTTTPTAPAAV